VAAKIKVIEKDEMIKILETAEPEGLFMAKDSEWYVGIDNTGEEILTEGFKTQEECAKWLRGGK